MSELTLDQALELVHPWLGTRLKCNRLYGDCHHTWANVFSYVEHDIPMPPATDELAMQVLRKLATELYGFNLEWSITDKWECLASGVRAEDPRDAIIIAAGMWLQGRKEKP